VYFVHSYAPVPDDPATVVGTCDYGGEIVAAVEDRNVHAMQFHPEKSGAAGLDLLGRFVELAAAVTAST
jgi:imidazoleglycerol phosphate synthase glutamine amidotransferase subunit HisH